LSRIVPSDLGWTEISIDTYNIAASLFTNGYVMKIPIKNDGSYMPVISKKY